MSLHESLGTSPAGTQTNDNGRDAPRSRALTPPVHAKPSGASVRLRQGRFARWHLDPAPVAEEEGWLLTYLDVITLLLVMMVVMLAFAGSGPHGVPANGPAGTGQLLARGAIQVIGIPCSAAPIPFPVPMLPASAEPALESEKPPEPDVLAGLALDFLDKNIEVIVKKGTVSFRISSEVLFNSGEATLSETGRSVMSRLVPTLGKIPGYRVVVEGHTDNMPIQTERFPSNWELSTGRAASVVRHFQGLGIEAARMRATGYADTRPIVSNDTAQGRATNRHVDVILEATR
ncbi:OmpA family protein [Polaromonas sp.]|uniref:OmpA/MotB family protein n=1 Tax=Polaromonas sp. TaxID=1869339 RepID=UPI0013BE4230|nr:OmpA family protein [Polaromonas sp.]NDP61699.1 OmpA family protein [Polaromonas sp.]